MIQKTFFRNLRKRRAAYAKERREIIAGADSILSQAKQAIFAMHRGAMDEAQDNLHIAEKHIMQLEKRFRRIPDLAGEGSYRAALEEYAEAQLFLAFLQKKKIGAVDAPGMGDYSYLGGVLDFTGEVVRYAVKMATEKNFKEVQRAHQAITEVAGEMMQLSLTGSLRNKYDQLKRNLQKAEEILYDLSLRVE